MFKRATSDFGKTGFDMSFLLLVGFVIIIFILIQFIADKKPAEESRQQGNVIVELFWNDDDNTDVDLWVQSPCPECPGGRDVPVGYSNKSGIAFNLLRDDTTNNPRADASGRNYEMQVSRGIRPGEYIVNAHLYRLGPAELPYPVKVVVSVKPDDNSASTQLFAVDGKLVRECHEKTFVRFTLDGQGNLVEGSVHHTQQNLRSTATCGDDRIPGEF